MLEIVWQYFTFKNSSNKWSEHIQKPVSCTWKIKYFFHWVTFILFKMYSFYDQVMNFYFGLWSHLTCHIPHLHCISIAIASFLIHFFHQSESFKMVFTCLKWKKYKRMAGLGGRWEKKRVMQYLETYSTHISPNIYMFYPYWILGIPQIGIFVHCLFPFILHLLLLLLLYIFLAVCQLHLQLQNICKWN